jgi:hypothetical protein
MIDMDYERDNCLGYSIYKNADGPLFQTGYGDAGIYFVPYVVMQMI